jgi:hypothetical protein
MFMLPPIALDAIATAIEGTPGFRQVFGVGGPSSVDGGAQDGSAAEGGASDAGDSGGADASTDGGARGVWFNRTQCTDPTFSLVRTELTQTRDEIDSLLPPLTLVFTGPSGERATVLAPATESYLYEITDVTPPTWCQGMCAETPQDQIAAIVGAAVIRSTVVIFDKAHSRIGFAPHKACQ